MIKPSNKREKARRSLAAAVFSGISIIYIFLHLGRCFDGSPESIEKSINHAITSPLDIFPVDRTFLASGIIMSLTVMLLMYQNFLNKRNLRPDEESGSASWNENLRKYYSKYADMVSRVHLPRLAGDNLPVRCINKVLDFLEKVISFRSQKINEDTGGDKTWVYVEDEEGRRIYKHNGTKNMILSQEVVMSMDTRKTLRNNNVVVIGGSGTGKSRFVMKPNILQANSSYVITDPSGELLESMGSFLKEKGYEIKVFNLVQMHHSNTYNPFAYIRNEEGVLTMINALIKNTTPKGSSTSDPFWGAKRSHLKRVSIA